jgi:hypothetical protein
MAEQWLSIVEYSRTFDVSDMTVRRRIKTGRLHAVLKDGKYYIPVGNEAPKYQEHAAAPAARPAQPQPTRHQNHQTHHAPVAKQIPSHQPQVQRSHPQAAETILAEENVPFSSQQKDSGVIPDTLRRPLASSDKSLIDTRALLAFCEAAIKKCDDSERRQADKFKYKISAMEEVMKQKDLEINSLRQQVEDLKLLINILEKKST